MSHAGINPIITPPHSSTGTSHSGIRVALIIKIVALSLSLLILFTSLFILIRRRLRRRAKNSKHRNDPTISARADSFAAGALFNNGRPAPMMAAEYHELSSFSHDQREGDGGLVQHIQRTDTVGSVAALPMYSNAPLAGEQVLGKEGERDGVDIVITMPEDDEYDQPPASRTSGVMRRSSVSYHDIGISHSDGRRMSSQEDDVPLLTTGDRSRRSIESVTSNDSGIAPPRFRESVDADDHDEEQVPLPVYSNI